MSHKHSYRVRVVRIYIDDVRLGQTIRQYQIVFATGPRATDPADAIHQAQCRELRNDEVLGPLAIELEQVDLVDAEVRYLRSEMLDGQRWNLSAEISIPWLERFPNVRNIIGDPTVRYGERQQAFS
jgi:hypothetical protein